MDKHYNKLNKPDNEPDYNHLLRSSSLVEARHATRAGSVDTFGPCSQVVATCAETVPERDDKAQMGRRFCLLCFSAFPSVSRVCQTLEALHCRPSACQHDGMRNGHPSQGRDIRQKRYGPHLVERTLLCDCVPNNLPCASH